VKLVFAGTPDFAAVALQALLEAGHEITRVLTQPDRPAGRGRRPQPSAVKRLALQRGLAVHQPQTLREAGGGLLEALRVDAMVVAAYGLILPPAVLAAPRLGCLNIHASLLPRWRGAAPIQRALLAGDAVTGITIMQMDAGLDTGPILLQRELPIADTDTAGSLHERLARLGGELIVRALAAPCRARAQDEAGATYAAKIDKREAVIDWRAPAREIERRVRAFDPTPGAQTRLAGAPLKVWAARIERGVAAEPGTVCAAGPLGLVVACGEEALRVTEVQQAGGRRLPVAAFLCGHGVAPGTRLGD
jgi:methionyl-tRNA formyltransferase